MKMYKKFIVAVLVFAVGGKYGVEHFNSDAFDSNAKLIKEYKKNHETESNQLYGEVIGFDDDNSNTCNVAEIETGKVYTVEACRNVNNLDEPVVFRKDSDSKYGYDLKTISW